MDALQDIPLLFVYRRCSSWGSVFKLGHDDAFEEVQPMVARGACLLDLLLEISLDSAFLTIVFDVNIPFESVL